MKELDEVIKDMEQCKYLDSDCSQCPALHYLKEYREKHDEILKMEEALGYCEIMDNPALSWDELKAMTGKPVWIELLRNGHWKGWDVIAGFDDDDFGDAMVTVHGDDYYFADLGKTWQAYRKERK